MSHFSTVVIVPPDCVDPKKFAAEVLEPYREREWFDGGKWDWWQRGGRWTGFFSNNGYNPQEDERNKRPCSHCAATEKRKWPDGERDCNVCNGTAVEILWPTDWAEYAGDYAYIEEMEKEPFAIVTPDGKWHEKGKMGWFGISTDHDENWPTMIKTLKQKFAGHKVMIVDCHI